MWLELILMALSGGVIVFGIEAYNNNWYERLISCHKIVVAARISLLDSRDINYLLESTGRYIEFGNRLYINNLHTASIENYISSRMARQILVSKMGGIS